MPPKTILAGSIAGMQVKPREGFKTVFKTLFRKHVLCLCVQEHHKVNGAETCDKNITPILQSVCLCEAPSDASLSGLTVDSCSNILFAQTTNSYTDPVSATSNVVLPSLSTSDNVHALETELVSLKEQLVVQSKVCHRCTCILLTECIVTSAAVTNQKHNSV